MAVGYCIGCELCLLVMILILKFTGVIIIDSRNVLQQAQSSTTRIDSCWVRIHCKI